MNIYFSLSLCFLPLILCLVSFKIFSKIKFISELSACLLGLLTVLPVVFIQFVVAYYFPQSRFFNSNQISTIFFRNLLVFGLMEETIKTLMIFLIPSKKINFIVFFLASLLLGICLGCFESSYYLLKEIQNASVKGGEIIYFKIFIRFISSDLIHLFCAGLCGIFVWSVKQKKVDFISLITAILIHGLYDFFANFSSFIQYFSIAAIFLAIIECRIHFEKNKPDEIYVKDEKPSKINSDITIETALKNSPVYNPKKDKKTSKKD